MEKEPNLDLPKFHEIWVKDGLNKSASGRPASDIPAASERLGLTAPLLV